MMCPLKHDFLGHKTSLALFKKLLKSYRVYPNVNKLEIDNYRKQTITRVFED